VASIGVMVT